MQNLKYEFVPGENHGDNVHGQAYAAAMLLVDLLVEAAPCDAT